MNYKKHETLMRIAQLWADNSSCERLKVGAVIAKETRIISSGYNGTISGIDNCCEDIQDCLCHIDNSRKKYHLPELDCNMCKDVGVIKITKEEVLHAEQNALMFALRHGISTVGASIYVTHSPCITCAKLIAQSGITEVWYNKLYRTDKGLELLEKVGIKINQLEIEQDNLEVVYSTDNFKFDKDVDFSKVDLFNKGSLC